MSLHIISHGISTMIVCSSASGTLWEDYMFFNIPTLKWNIVENENKMSARSWPISISSDHA